MLVGDLLQHCNRPATVHAMATFDRAKNRKLRRNWKYEHSSFVTAVRATLVASWRLSICSSICGYLDSELDGSFCTAPAQATVARAVQQRY
eukprot:IDg5301t1